MDQVSMGSVELYEIDWEIFPFVSARWTGLPSARGGAQPASIARLAAATNPSMTRCISASVISLGIGNWSDQGTVTGP